ncbi:MAG: DNA polymerase ligase N-terminal domain-containing protein [Fuerstiella sp.]|nr:DNA polymerase ligase N-terminal domain-containing protein [Fuerstiella sp.]
MKSETQRSRFVILEHDHPFLHWDLLLQQGEVLAGWRLLSPVAIEAWIPSESLPDHRLMYLDYEGPVSNNRGMVTRVACGEFSICNDSPEERIYQLFNCNVATAARCRRFDSATPEWRFE